MPQFIESIKIQHQELHHSDLHQKRVLETFHHFKQPCRLNIEALYKQLNFNKKGLYKWRLIYNLNNDISSEIQEYHPPLVNGFELVTDDTLFYPYKALDRTSLNELKHSSKASEVIIIRNNCITDTSFSNLLFFKKKQWFTPEDYLLNGVQRQFLLSKNLIKTAKITTETIANYSHFLIINAMNTFDENKAIPITNIINLP